MEARAPETELDELDGTARGLVWSCEVNKNGIDRETAQSLLAVRERPKLCTLESGERD